MCFLVVLTCCFGLFDLLVCIVCDCLVLLYSVGSDGWLVIWLLLDGGLFLWCISYLGCELFLLIVLICKQFFLLVLYLMFGSRYDVFGSVVTMLASRCCFLFCYCLVFVLLDCCLSLLCCRWVWFAVFGCWWFGLGFGLDLSVWSFGCGLLVLCFWVGGLLRVCWELSLGYCLPAYCLLCDLV